MCDKKSNVNPAVSFDHESPMWKRAKDTDTCEIWEIELYSHQLIGALSMNVEWLKEQHVGNCLLYRNGEFVCLIPLEDFSAKNETVEEFKDRAWDMVLGQLTNVSAYLQDYVAFIKTTKPRDA